MYKEERDCKEIENKFPLQEPFREIIRWHTAKNEKGKSNSYSTLSISALDNMIRCEVKDLDYMLETLQLEKSVAKLATYASSNLTLKPNNLYKFCLPFRGVSIDAIIMVGEGTVEIVNGASLSFRVSKVYEEAKKLKFYGFLMSISPGDVINLLPSNLHMLDPNESDVEINCDPRTPQRLLPLWTNTPPSTIPVSGDYLDGDNDLSLFPPIVSDISVVETLKHQITILEQENANLRSILQQSEHESPNDKSTLTAMSLNNNTDSQLHRTVSYVLYHNQALEISTKSISNEAYNSLKIPGQFFMTRMKVLLKEFNYDGTPELSCLNNDDRRKCFCLLMTATDALRSHYFGIDKLQHIIGKGVNTFKTIYKGVEEYYSKKSCEARTHLFKKQKKGNKRKKQKVSKKI